jgi:hypothetical protein
MSNRGIRSKTIARIYETGKDQGFEGGFHRGSSHYYLRCLEPGCNFMQTLSSTQNDGNSQKTLNIITQLRRHGFVWQGRGGEHTAALLYEQQEQKKEAA